MSGIDLADNAALIAAISTGGARQLSFDEDILVSEAILVLYDNGVDSFLTKIEFTSAQSDDETVNTNELIATTVATFSGVGEATTILEAQFLTFVA